MRPLDIERDKNKKNRTGQILIGVFLIIIMTLSIADLAFQRSTDSTRIKYKDIDFLKTDNYWQFKVQDYQFSTLYNPEEVKDISFLSYSSLQNYVGKPLYFAGNSLEPSFEISRNLVERFVTRVSEACIDEGDCDENLPVKNCTKDNVIIFKIPEEGKKERMYQEENCVYIIASSENQTRYADKFLYTALGL